MDYKQYKISAPEEIIIKRNFEIYLRDSGINPDDSGWSQPEMDHFYDTFKHGWIMGLSFIRS
jgi:hypothetical protein